MNNVLLLVLLRLLSYDYISHYCYYVLDIVVSLITAVPTVTMTSCYWITRAATTITTVRSFWLWCRDSMAIQHHTILYNSIRYHSISYYYIILHLYLCDVFILYYIIL